MLKTDASLVSMVFSMTMKLLRLAILHHQVPPMSLLIFSLVPTLPITTFKKIYRRFHQLNALLPDHDLRHWQVSSMRLTLELLLPILLLPTLSLLMLLQPKLPLWIQVLSKRSTYSPRRATQISYR